MNILQLTSHYSPNVGGVETHLDDLVKGLVKREHGVFVLTYQPLTAGVSAKVWDNLDKRTIFRIPWFTGLFYKLVNHPVLEFLYLLPGLWICLPLVLVFKKIDVIHAHGLVAGFVAVFWSKVFRKKTVISLHNIYHFPKSGFYKEFAKVLLNHADNVLTLSYQSAKELEDLGVSKVGVFTYWVDLQRFYPKKRNRKRGSFRVLFVGRLISIKGVKELLKAAKSWNKEIRLAIAGTGPLEKDVIAASKDCANIHYIGRLKNEDLPEQYNDSDILIVPSTHEEGFGRVIIEALACGVPVIGSSRGAIPEAMDDSVGLLIDVTPENIKLAVESLYRNRKLLQKLSSNARSFAEKRYSEMNIERIIESYHG